MFKLYIVLCLSIVHGNAWSYPAQEGDLVFHTSTSAQSLAIQQATGSRYSHMGIVLFKKGQAYVFEASATVQYTLLQRWIDRGQDQHYIAKRLRTPLTPQQIKALYTTAKSFEGKAYDLTFEWSDHKLYCSELVWKIYDRALDIQIGSLQKVREFNLHSTEVRQKIHERYGKHLPLDQEIISPNAMFNSLLLVTVSEK